jgi:hypothetical protein
MKNRSYDTWGKARIKQREIEQSEYSSPRLKHQGPPEPVIINQGLIIDRLLMIKPGPVIPSQIITSEQARFVFPLPLPGTRSWLHLLWRYWVEHDLVGKLLRVR